MKRTRIHPFLFLLPAVLLFFAISCSRTHSSEYSAPAQPANPLALQLQVPVDFRFVAFGDTRFHDPSDVDAANPAVRQALVAAIDQEHPAFISLGGDLVYAGDSQEDWRVWDSETAVWREHKIPVYPAIGNHELKGNQQNALGNYFARFPDLHGSRFYSVRAANTLMLVLDSALGEVSGPQGDWLRSMLEHLPSDIDFVFVVLHHPPYTSSSNEHLGGGHSARSHEQMLAAYLEERQTQIRARIVLFSGHVHNYERHEHGGITYFVTGGGGAHAYPVPRKPDDPYRDPGINYHYLLAQVDRNRLSITMHKLEFKDGHSVWSTPDAVVISAPLAIPATSP